MADEKKYLIDTNENREYLRQLRAELLNFCKRFASPGGGAYYLGDDGTPWTERNRECYETSRMAYSYALADMLGVPGSRELAAAAMKGLTGEMHDHTNGGWYGAVQSDGTPVSTKMAYAHAFVILAAATCRLDGIEGADALLKDAEAVFEKYFLEADTGMVRDSWNAEFTVTDPYRGLNACMHSVEAFLADADATDNALWRDRAGVIIRKVVSWAEGNEWRIPEHYSTEWVADMECNRDNPADPFKPYGATPGHGMEWSRLIAQWALSTGDPEIGRKYVNAAEELYKRAVADAWNCDGAPGFVYTSGWDGKPVVHERMHWVLAEGINTAAVLYHATGNERYARDYAEFLEYLENDVRDHVNGSWYHQMDAQNHVSGTVWPGKPDLYHALQATLIPYAPIDCSICRSISDCKG